MKRAIVASFPRSGTHFLMNTLAINFGYISDPYIDIEASGNLYAPLNMIQMVQKITDDEPNPRIIMKTHHEAAFFGEFVWDLVEQYQVFYVYRNKEDTMNSYAKHLVDLHNMAQKQGLTWSEGPVVDSGMSLAAAAPMGGMLRYQYRQYTTISDKWNAHLTGWMCTLQPDVQEQIVYVSFENLRDKFNETVKAIAKQLNVVCDAPIVPSKDMNVVKDGEFVRKESNIITPASCT